MRWNLRAHRQMFKLLKKKIKQLKKFYKKKTHKHKIKLIINNNLMITIKSMKINYKKTMKMCKNLIKNNYFSCKNKCLMPLVKYF